MKHPYLRWLIGGLTDTEYRPWADLTRLMVLFSVPYAATVLLGVAAGALLPTAVLIGWFFGGVAMGFGGLMLPETNFRSFYARALERLAAICIAIVIGKYALRAAFALSAP